ncbi:MAG: SHOCT domain-containing protein [Actinomycetes bacterium]
MSEQAETAAVGRVPRERLGVAAKIMIVVATLLATVSIFAVWANRQVLDEANWTRTSTELLGDKAIRGATATYLTDLIYRNVNVQKEIEKALPDQAQVLAGPAATALRGVAQDAIDKALQTSVVQAIWEAANKLAITQVINLVEEGNTGPVNFKGNDVKLDLRPAAVDLAGKVGLQDQAQQIPADAANITVFSSDQIGQYRAIAKFLDGVSLVLPLLTLLLLIGAVAVSAGRRRRALVAVGWSLIVAAILSVLIRNIAEGPFVDSLAKTDAVRPAVTSTWKIATGMIPSVAWNLVFVAVAILLAAALAGHHRAAVAIREWAAPWVNERPGLGYAAGFGLLGLILLWGPIPATREWLTVLIFIALTGLGIWALERQLLEEYPDATSSAQAESLRELWERLKGGVSTGVAKGGDAARQAAGQVRDRYASATDRGAPAPAPAAAPVPAAVPQRPVVTAPTGAEPAGAEAPTGKIEAPLDVDRLELLERLGKLRDSGILSEDEFAAEKTKILG